MTDHASPGRREFHPSTELWRPPAFLTQFWRPRTGFGTRFCKTKKDIDQEVGEKYETLVVGVYYGILLPPRIIMVRPCGHILSVHSLYLTLR